MLVTGQVRCYYSGYCFRKAKSSVVFMHAVVVRPVQSAEASITLYWSMLALVFFGVFIKDVVATRIQSMTIINCITLRFTVSIWN